MENEKQVPRNPRRLIDANDPLKQLSDYMEKLHCSDDYRDGLYRGMEIAESYINNAPTVDAVEVVRCKGCKCAYINSFSAASGVAVCKHWSNEVKTVIVQQDDFCSYGERREGE